jgi:hypothetical protein
MTRQPVWRLSERRDYRWSYPVSVFHSVNPELSTPANESYAQLFGRLGICVVQMARPRGRHRN